MIRGSSIFTKRGLEEGKGGGRSRRKAGHLEKQFIRRGKNKRKQAEKGVYIRFVPRRGVLQEKSKRGGLAKERDKKKKYKGGKETLESLSVE